ncbi:cell wall-associated NlpC family hydrolase [Rhizobium aquaticum]|uniref:Cell wall-associated NlpC family hydrolase n=1 Tax=Rhizobium aquaticum TaxID=1549636 RepID=A0ABV2ITC4_9HYPH
MDERFIGIPYIAHGRDYSGADCWGIVFLFYRDVLGLQIPAYSAEMKARAFHHREIGALIEAERAAHWIEISEPANGDVALMRSGRDESHVGIFVAGGMILHSEGEPGSCLVRADDMRVRSRLVGYFRVRA